MVSILDKGKSFESKDADVNFIVNARKNFLCLTATYARYFADMRKPRFQKL